MPAAGRSKAQAEQLARYFKEQRRHSLAPGPGASGASFASRRAELEARIPTVMVMEDLPTSRSAFVLKRGRYDMPDTSQKVDPGVPACPGCDSDGLARQSPGLARWLASPDNPLTARVAVNRLWQQHFGTGLVKTTENFGLQGEPPSHPALLDWLAAEFIRTGWDLKAMHRLIVSSATYRQASKASASLVQRDPENRLLARGPQVSPARRAGARQCPGHRGTAHHPDRWALGQALPAGRALGRAGRRGRGSPLRSGQGREPLPPQPLRLPQADRSLSRHGQLRRSQPARSAR